MIKLDSGVRRFDTVFVVALLTLFALTASLMVFICAKQYNITAGKMNTNYESRTISSYLREKTRQADASSMVQVVDYHGVQALALSQELESGLYTTYIYSHDGYLYEAFLREGSTASLSTGDKILSITEFNPVLDSYGNIEITYTTSDTLEHRVIINTHSAKGSISNE